MQITRNRAPSQRGAKRLLDQHNTKLVCVCYRNNEQRRKLSKTSKLIKESLWQLPACPFWKEVHWHNQVKVAGGKWNSLLKLWGIPYGQARKLELVGWVQQAKVSFDGKSEIAVASLLSPHDS